MSVSKIQFDGNTLIDLTSDTVVASKLHRGYTAHDANGDTISGTYDPPSGSMNITVNNTTYDVTDKASVVVSVPTSNENSRAWKFTQTADSAGGATIQVLNSDDWLKAHKSDTSLVMTICTLSTITETAKYVYMWTQTNKECYANSSGKFGRAIHSQQSSATIATNGISQAISSATSQGFIIDSNTGALSIVVKNAGAANLILPAGDWLITAAISPSSQ